MKDIKVVKITVVPMDECENRNSACEREMTNEEKLEKAVEMLAKAKIEAKELEKQLAKEKELARSYNDGFEAGQHLSMLLKGLIDGGLEKEAALRVFETLCMKGMGQ